MFDCSLTIEYDKTITYAKKYFKYCSQSSKKKGKFLIYKIFCFIFEV